MYAMYGVLRKALHECYAVPRIILVILLGIS